jgi:23S rRNA (cytosine1962-C5)-methyltransferase
MIEKKVTLKQGKERSIELNRHPWIFSGAIASFSDNILPGDLAFVYRFDGVFLAQAYFNLDNSLSGRILSFDKRPIQNIVLEKIQKAKALRNALLDQSKTNCFRLINAEEDGLPGLIVDIYDNVLVLQVNTAGMEKLKTQVVEALCKEMQPVSIYEKSISGARLQEGLMPQEGLLYGKEVSELIVKENGISFIISITDGQKTGFFLDQREMRKQVGELAKNRSLLNCFSYSGGFSLHALNGGASQVTSVDICPRATALCERNSELGGFSKEKHKVVQEDVFDFLKQDSLDSYDFIILDPPAFAKKRKDIEAATLGYRRINQAVMEKCRPGTLLLACSCSYYVDPSLFQQILFQAASGAKREVKILSKHIHALDHPVSLFHREGDYLKSFLLWVE